MTEQHSANLGAFSSAGSTARGATRHAPSWERAAGSAGRHWGLHLVNGVVMVLIGVLALVWPGVSLLALSILFAITLLANGVTQILGAVADSDNSGGRRVLLGVLGALSLLAGVLCLRVPLQTLAVIALLIGSWWVVSGVLTLVAAMTGGGERGRGWGAALGLLSVVGGFVVLLQPGISLLALEVTLGVVLIVLGVLVAVDAIRSRGTART